MAISAPQPAVLHLPTIFRQISAGEIRIPAFQRSYIWKQSQVTDLLTSVRDEFPIGSILLWQVDRKMLELAGRNATTFPVVEERYPTNYVLDGMQRLSSLFGVFNYEDGDDDRLNVVYDLRVKGFFNRADLEDHQIESSIQMAAFLSPRRLLSEQARLSNLQDGDCLLEEMLATQAAFQEYLIPVVTIKSDDISRIVGIFERTNSTGTRLDTIDFMRAITWDQSFDLNYQLEATRGSLEALDLDIPDETIIKCVGLVLGVGPTSEGLLTLRSADPASLKEAFKQFMPALERVASFLKDYFSVSTFSHVPYEGEILVAFHAIGLNLDADDGLRSRLARWFWATGFNESLRGKPDHYVVRAVKDWKGLLEGSIRGLEPRLRLSAQDFAERRMIKGRALSSTFAAMFAANRACSLVTGNEIDPFTFLADTNTEPFDAVFTKKELEHSGLTGSSSRLFANLVVKDSFYETVLGRVPPMESIPGLAMAGQYDALASQFISREAAEAAIAGDVHGFLNHRSEALKTAANSLVDTGAITPPAKI